MLPKPAPPRLLQREHPRHGVLYYNGPRGNHQIARKHEATQRLRMLRAVVFAGPLLVVSSVGLQKLFNISSKFHWRSIFFTNAWCWEKNRNDCWILEVLKEDERRPDNEARYIIGFIGWRWLCRRGSIIWRSPGRCGYRVPELG